MLAEGDSPLKKANSSRPSWQKHTNKATFEAMPAYTSINRQDLMVLFILFPPLSFVMNYHLFGPRYWEEAQLLTWVTLIGFAVWFVSWRVHLLAAQWLRVSLNDFKSTIKRTVIVLSIFIPMTVLTVWGQFTLSDAFHLFGYTLENRGLVRGLLTGLIFNFICNSFHEGMYLFDNWRKSLLEAQALKKAHLQSQLDGLKSQVNPHFLFNSLNSLSSLIGEDAVRAERFLCEMSKVYRYLLQNNEQGLVTLATELKFTRSYFHLLKTRYEDGIYLAIDIDQAEEEKLLPPLTLQLLLENAVKHNVILPETPLQVKLHINEEGRLVVQNNLMKKRQAVASNKVGLANIREKYKLLNQPDIEVQETVTTFIVTIPLIQKH